MSFTIVPSTSFSIVKKVQQIVDIKKKGILGHKKAVKNRISI